MSKPNQDDKSVKASDEYLEGWIAAARTYAAMTKWQLIRTNFSSQIAYIEKLLKKEESL